jgi:hypothetical protein
MLSPNVLNSQLRSSAPIMLSSPYPPTLDHSRAKSSTDSIKTPARFCMRHSATTPMAPSTLSGEDEAELRNGLGST